MSPTDQELADVHEQGAAYARRAGAAEAELQLVRDALKSADECERRWEKTLSDLTDGEFDQPGGLESFAARLVESRDHWKRQACTLAKRLEVSLADELLATKNADRLSTENDALRERLGAWDACQREACGEGQTFEETIDEIRKGYARLLEQERLGLQLADEVSRARELLGGVVGEPIHQVASIVVAESARRNDILDAARHIRDALQSKCSRTDDEEALCKAFRIFDEGQSVERAPDVFDLDAALLRWTFGADTESADGFDRSTGRLVGCVRRHRGATDRPENFSAYHYPGRGVQSSAVGEFDTVMHAVQGIEAVLGGAPQPDALRKAATDAADELERFAHASCAELIQRLRSAARVTS